MTNFSNCMVIASGYKDNESVFAQEKSEMSDFQSKKGQEGFQVNNIGDKVTNEVINSARHKEDMRGRLHHVGRGMKKKNTSNKPRKSNYKVSHMIIAASLRRNLQI